MNPPCNTCAKMRKLMPKPVRERLERLETRLNDRRIVVTRTKKVKPQEPAK